MASQCPQAHSINEAGMVFQDIIGRGFKLPKDWEQEPDIIGANEQVPLDF